MKMPKKNSSSSPPRDSSVNSPNRCAFETADGRRCRMLRHRGHPSLCIFHARDEMQLLESTRLGAELSASLTGDFLTATDVNFVLGKLFKALAQKRISQRDGATLAYVAQLMLFSLRNVKQEFNFKYPFEQWDRMLTAGRRLSDVALPATSISATQSAAAISSADPPPVNSNCGAPVTSA
jgi:hypothetical protein